MAARVQITKVGDGRIIAGRPVPVRAGQVVVLDTRAASRLVAEGVALYVSAQDRGA